jgi:hypothetical protein
MSRIGLCAAVTAGMLTAAMASPQTTLSWRGSRLDPSEWPAYFEELETDDGGLLASVVEPLAMRSGGRVVARRLLGISYDAAARMITVHVGHREAGGAFLRYFVSMPYAIEVRDHAAGKVIAVLDDSGACTLIHLSFAGSASGVRELANG